MTEEEAKKKWCPFARVGGTGYSAYNRDALSDGLPKRGMCIASDCMMWRWGLFGPVTKEYDGYCGLAGKP